MGIFNWLDDDKETFILILGPAALNLWIIMQMFYVMTVPPDNIPIPNPKAAFQDVIFQAKVDINDFTFFPKVIYVQAGSVVIWKNNDAIGHSVTSENGSFDTGIIAPGERASVSLDKPGTYGYYCRIHPYMTGLIVVSE